MLSKETLLVFGELLRNVRISPLDPDADRQYTTLANARNELTKVIQELEKPAEGEQNV